MTQLNCAPSSGTMTCTGLSGFHRCRKFFFSVGEIFRLCKKVERTICEGYLLIYVDTSDRTLGKKLAKACNEYFKTNIAVDEQEVRNAPVNKPVRGKEKTEDFTVEVGRKRFEGWRKAYKLETSAYRREQLRTFQ